MLPNIEKPLAGMSAMGAGNGRAGIGTTRRTADIHRTAIGGLIAKGVILHDGSALTVAVPTTTKQHRGRKLANVPNGADA
jgi:hypothetical protein